MSALLVFERMLKKGPWNWDCALPRVCYHRVVPDAQSSRFFWIGRIDMKQILPLLLATGLAVTLGGCQSATEEGSADYTLVSLTVPNMV